MSPVKPGSGENESDLKKLKRKMLKTWMANGVLLGWLVDPKKEVVYIYRQGQAEVKEVRDFETSVLIGEEVLPGFEFSLVVLSL
jgi:Uma2 family endonuclease